VIATVETMSGTAVVLRAVLASVDAGELEAELDQGAYLQGMADALELVAGRPEPGVPPAGRKPPSAT
jgi:hypothetical protein